MPLSPPDADERPLPLAGVRVLELGALIGGPYASALLAQFGAEAVKVEPPGSGDALRNWRQMHGDTSLCCTCRAATRNRSRSI